jgi:hypothetical protein
MSRSQRRRQPVRSQQRREASSVGVATERLTVSRPARRMGAEPIDYSQDYAWVRQDLIRILLWGGLLFVGMLAFYFVR